LEKALQLRLDVAYFVFSDSRIDIANNEC